MTKYGKGIKMVGTIFGKDGGERTANAIDMGMKAKGAYDKGKAMKGMNTGPIKSGPIKSGPITPIKVNTPKPMIPKTTPNMASTMKPIKMPSSTGLSTVRAAIAKQEITSKLRPQSK